MSPSSVRLAKVPVAVISVVILVVLMPTGSAQLTCYSCKECDTYDPNQMVECVSDCSVWYSTSDEETTVHRGCLEEAEVDAIIYDQCGTDRCNTVQVARCARCASTATAQCANVICPTSADQCYLNPADGHRGCTSDQNYEVDCTAGSNSCTTCTSEPDQPCNAIRMCVVCDASKNPECLEDDALFVQQCPETSDRCYRYMDTEQTLHLGCTSDEDYSINCRDAGNCRVCSSDECNREDKFECYICDDCTSVEVGLDSKIECNIVEDSRCYTGYDAITKQTHRGCFSESVQPYDVFDLCEDSACNDRIFPDHLQCYQCVGCDDVNGADLSYCSNSKASSCYMMLADTVGTKTLIRGCNTDEQYADCQIDRNCVTCERDQCNGESSQMTRFCDRCDGVEECEKQILTYNCGDRSFTNQCYLYSDGLGVLKKGCILELDPAMAEACYDPSDTRCTICKDIQCNRKHCVRCDTRTDGLVCVLGDKTVPALRYALCDGDVCRVEIDSEGHTVRGCLEDFLKPCAAGSCRETLLAGSNGGLFPANRRQCFQCEGDDCWMGQQAEDGQYCQLYRGSEDGCYIYNVCRYHCHLNGTRFEASSTRFENGTTIVRGCTTDLGAKCVTGSDDPHCVVSFEDLKNDIAQQQAPITCYQDCSENVLSCVPVTCPAPSDRCFLSVSYSGVVTRGCTSSNCPSDSKDCFTCKEPNCNGVYSVCSSCDTMTDIDCTVGEEHGEVCEQSIGCFQYQSVDRALYGCAEKAPEFCLNEEEHCKFCDQSFCNSKALSLCYSCTDCRNVLTPIVQKTQLCATESDHCITGLVGDRIDRGCRSDMPQPIEDYIVIEDCTEPTCNRAPITDWASCYACTDCAEVTTETAVLCLNPATNQCYTLRSANGVISRGCATETALFDCDDGINCAVCDYDNCNNLVVPREFSCVQCGRSESCADYNVLSICPNQLGLVVDACVTHKADTGIMKGCMSSIELFVLCYGTTNNGRCNVTLESQSNARPVQCVDCKADAECVRGDLNELQTATYFHGSCVSFLDESGDVVRGNVVEYPECRDSSHCVECFHDGCNVGLFPEDRLLCYQCSGVECAQLANSALMPEPCLRYDAANAKCYTWYGSASSAQRGCLLDDDSICQMEGVSCQSCTESGCNDVQYDSFSDTKMCVKCSTNRACDENPTVESCSTGGGCYTFYSELLVTAKGCVSELRESMAWYDECTAGTASERCERCFGDLCNRNKCYVCNSRDGPASNCIQPNLENTVSSTCIESEECVAFIDDNGHTVRGCSDSFEQDQIAKCSGSSGTCLRCMGDHCNGGALPKDRIKCYQCSGTIECLNPSKDSERYCDVYLEGENSCYTYFQDETTVERGCTLQRAEPCDQHCQKCNITGCNDQPAFVQNSLTCAQCLGDDCPAIDASEAAIAKPCPAEILFGRTEQCYSYFHPNGTLERGCLSELTKNRPPIAAQCLDESDVRCKFCSDSGCNVRNVKCFVCNTNTYAGCADNLEEAKHNALLQTCGTGHCVSLVEETTTRKGCAEDFKVKCDSGNICHTFEGPKSNSAVYPTSRLQCFKCQGSTCDEVQSSARTAACQQYNLNDECYTYVSDAGETFRGCVSDPLETNPCIVHPDHCVRCDSKSGCNTEPSRRSNGLICAQCSRAIDCEQSTRFAQCTQPLLLGRQDSCYVHSFAGEILARGCLSDAAVSLRDKCANAGNSECSLCRCDRCNGPPVRCVACEGETGCGDTLKTSENELVPCQTASCVSFVEHFANGSSLIIKGCSELYESDTCSKGHATDGTYQLCHSSGCNDVLFPVSRLKCYQCEGESCSDPSLEPTICEPYREGEMCYSYMNRPKKGCVGQLRDGEECEQDAGRCGVCDSTDGCNVEPRALECISCSSKTNPSCVDPMTRVLDKKICPIGGCATIIDDDGYTVRGCAAEFDASSELCSGPDGTCEVCTEGDSCNGALFPSNRLQCYQCSGANCLDVTQQTPSVCQLYNSTNDACYTYAVSPTNIRRGCLSDAISECPDKCVTCASGDGCNDLPPIVANTLTCLHCEGPDCAKLQHTDQGTVCPDILLGHIDACYTFVEQHTVRRGCLSEDTACNPAGANCHVCADENDCNVDEYAVTLHECVLCDESVLGERCKWGYEQSTAQRCHPSDASLVQVGCYTCYATFEQTIGNNTLLTSVFHRGCVGEERQVECQPDTVQVCLGAGCNQRNEQLQICAKCMENGCDGDQWSVEECRGIVPYDRRGCYVMRDVRNRIYARGCLAELSADTRKLCSSAKDASCRTCFGNECNHAAVGLERVPFLWTLLLALLLALCSTR